jgi:hypothetical protein
MPNKALVLVAAAVLEAREKPSLHDLDGEPGELVGHDVLGGAGGLAGDELEMVAGRDVDHGAADASVTPASPSSLSLAVPKNRPPFLVHPDVPVARPAEGPVDVALEAEAPLVAVNSVLIPTMQQMFTYVTGRCSDAASVACDARGPQQRIESEIS